jgi:hypothetical protein
VSADGGARVLRFDPDGGVRATSYVVAKHAIDLALPSPDGKYAYTVLGEFSTEGRLGVRLGGTYFFTVPTAHGSGLFLSLPVTPAAGLEPSVRLHLTGSQAPVAILTSDVDTQGLRAREPAGELPTVPPQQRFHLWPAAGLLAVLPSSNNRIELHRVNVGDHLAKSPKEYLVIGSDPPPAATRGSEWRYRPTVWSSGEQPQLELLPPHPPGMRVSGGEVIWTPTDQSPASVEVRIRAKDPSDERQAEQKFRVVVADSGE